MTRLYTLTSKLYHLWLHRIWFRYFSYHVLSAAEEEASNFDFLIELLNKAKSNLPKTLIFFNQIKVLAAAFSYITHHIGQEAGHPSPAVAMYTSVTDGDRKTSVLNDLNNPTGTIRVVLCTSSLAVGINVSKVVYIIHYGTPKLAQDFLQETGRAARESSAHGHSLLLTFPHENSKGLSEPMKDYKRGLSCRRNILLAQFKSSSTMSGKGTCCDVCNREMTHPYKSVMERYFDLCIPDTVSESSDSIGSPPSLGNIDTDSDGY